AAARTGDALFEPSARGPAGLGPDERPHVEPHAPTHWRSGRDVRLGRGRHAARRADARCEPAGGHGRCGHSRHRGGQDPVQADRARDRHAWTQQDHRRRPESRRPAEHRRRLQLRLLPRGMMVNVFIQAVNRRSLALIVCESLLITVAVGLTAYLLYGEQAHSFLMTPNLALKSLLIAFMCQVCLYYADLYEFGMTSDRRELLAR